MWLVERDTNGMGLRRIAVPTILREALVRWYTGEGSHDDEAAGITLVQQARVGGRWLACDCLPANDAPPILTPAFLSEAETYYLRRLTSPKRPEHRADCPFFRDQVTHRLTEIRRPGMPAEPPSGYFEVLKPAPEKLAQRPEEDASDDRTRQASVPRLARLLWRLLVIAGVNRCPPLADAPSAAARSISDEFKAITAAAARLEVAPGIELGRVLWTHAAALHSRRVYAALRAIAGQWPSGHAPQGFILLFANTFRGTEIHVPGSDPIRVANRVQSPSSHSNPVDGPYLVIVVAGQYPEARGYAPLRAYAQPIYSGHRFIPVEASYERQAIKAVLGAQRELDRASIDLAVEKPIFDRLTPLGACRPDFVLEARSRSTGEIKKVALEILASDDPEYRTAKIAGAVPLRAQLPVVEIIASELNAARVAEKLAAALEM